MTNSLYWMREREREFLFSYNNKMVFLKNIHQTLKKIILIGPLRKNCPQWSILRHMVLDSNCGQALRLSGCENKGVRTLPPQAPELIPLTVQTFSLVESVFCFPVSSGRTLI